MLFDIYLQLASKINTHAMMRVLADDYMENTLLLPGGNGIDIYLFLISASLRPSLGVSTVRAIALNPALSARLTSCATTFRSLYT